LVSLDHNSSTNRNNPHLYSEGDGKRADRGVDGYLKFYEYEDQEKISKAAKHREPIRGHILVQVKGAHVQRNDVATLIGDASNQKFSAASWLHWKSQPSQ
jgi:hypothetical protein